VVDEVFLMSLVPVLFPAYPELLLVLSTISLLMLGVFVSREATRLVTLFSLITLVSVLFLVGVSNKETMTTFNSLFIVDQYTLFAKSMVLVAATFSIVLIMPWARHEGIDRYELPLIVLFATLGMMIMISANDFISLYLGLELQSLSLYILCAFNRGNGRSAEAGVKYFVLGALASGLFLYGVSLIYGFSGTTSFTVLSSNAYTSGYHIGAVIGMVMVTASFAFKVSAVPFHMWTPDVYEGAPTPITAFFSVAPKITGLCVLVKTLIVPFGGLKDEWGQILIFLSIASMLWGGIAAISQRNVKRLMAYSSIGHVGYALVGAVAGTADGLRGMLYYLLIYMFMNIGVFSIILSMKVNKRYVEDIGDLRGISRTNPYLSLALSILLFSMAGIPPLAGFFGKYFLFSSAVSEGFVFLAVIGVLSSVIAAFYYIRLIKIIYFEENINQLDKVDFSTSTVTALCTIVIFLFILMPQPFLIWADIAASALFVGL
jgi:NADH-quinone oxidoreductase subunit N